MDVTTIGIDLAKRIFHVHGVDKNGKTVLKKKLMRDKVLEFMANLPKCLVGMEACGGANYWSREISKLGHEVRLMAPQFVKPYIKTNKNDEKDAEGICEAVNRPSMRFVPVKTIDQQDVLSIHRVRERLVKNRTALSNEIRGLLHEFGIIIPQGIHKVMTHLNEALEGNRLSEMSIETFRTLKDEFLANDKRITELEKRLKFIAQNNEAHAQLMEIPGIGLITATALIASIGNAANFENGRQLSAWLGLVPRQHSTGGKQNLLGISRRGDVYLRNLLIQGARSVFTQRVAIPKKKETLKTNTSVFSDWMINLSSRRGFNTSVVAVANKLARVVYAVLSKGQTYTENKVCRGQI
jgi:transposase